MSDADAHHETGATPDRPPATTGRIQAGTVLQVLPNSRFLVELADGSEVVAHQSGTMRIKLVRAVAGDEVSVQISPFDSTKGRIVAPESRARGCPDSTVGE